MQKICALILLSGLISTLEGLPQTKWSRPIPSTQGQLTRERRQFPFGEWIPLSQPCPTCRPFADPLDAGARGENIGLTPPRPPTVTRQIHGEGNFFPQDESSILSVPPPPPSAIPRQPLANVNSNFQNLQFSGFGQQFNSPLPVPTQQIFPQTQQVQFLPQTFLSNQQLLVGNNQQILPTLNGQGNAFRQENQAKQQIGNGKVQNFNGEFKTQKLPENVVLEQNKRPVGGKQFSNKPTPFTLPQQSQQHSLAQQQTFGGQQHSVNFANSILTPPPAPKNVTQDVVIPGLDKEEIQLLYVPVETLRQRGNFQEQQLLSQQHQNIQFHNRPNGLQPTERPTTTQPKGHFVTQGGKTQEQSANAVTVTSPQPFPSTATPSTLLLQNLPFQGTPQPFVSATPATPTVQPFVTPSSVSQKFSPFTPETTLPHLVTIPNGIQFSQSDLGFGTTPKSVLNQGVFQGDVINGKSQFSGFKTATFQTQDQPRPLQEGKQENVQQVFLSQQQPGVQPQKTIFLQEQEKEINVQSNFPSLQLINQQQIALQKQQEQERLIQQQKEKELQEEYLLKQRQQKELEAQRLLQQQRQKELEEQRLLQQRQRQKELEEQRILQQQRQKELEEQRLLQQQRQKELEEQRFLQQQRQKELEEQRLLQQQRQKELENQRRLQLQRQKELDEKRRLQQLKQREEEQQRLIRFQQQQKELEQQRILQQQQEEQERLLQQQLLERQKQENLKKQQQFQFFQQQQIKQQQQQQQQQQQKHQSFPQLNRLPANDKLNLISQLEKESEPESNLVPHQPPLSVFFKGYEGADAKIVDVLRELRSSNTITVLDQYFEKMPKVFVGPAGLVPPAGYRKFELPYLSNLETNRIERKIDRLPFFVAPLNFVPPPGYAKIPFPAPHVGSVVVSSESNPAMKAKPTETGLDASSGQEEQDSGSFPMVGPELPGLINGLETETTTIKVFSSTPSLPQTTAQLRNRRPNNSLYRPQSRKPVSKTRVQTTSRPEEEVTQPVQKVEVTKDSESGLRKPFNRFLNRRRQQAKSTTESSPQSQQEGKNLENRHYSVEVYHQQKNTNQLPRTQQKSDILRETQNQDHRFGSAIDRTTPGGQEVYDVHPTPNFYKIRPTAESEERRPDISDYSDNLQTFEDGPLPTGSAKTITQELYRPNAIQRASGETDSKSLSKADDSQSSEKFQSGSYELTGTTSFAGESDAPNPTAAFASQTVQKDISEELVRVQPTLATEYENQEPPKSTSERYYATEAPRAEFSLTPGSVTLSGEQQTKGFSDSNEQYTSAFAEISKHHHIPGPTESSKRYQTKYSDVDSTPDISLHLQAPVSKEYSQQQPDSPEFVPSAEPTPTQQSGDFSGNKFSPTGTSNEQYSTGFGLVSKPEQQSVRNEGFPQVPSSQASPAAPAFNQHVPAFGVHFQAQNSGEVNRHSQDERTGSFVSFQNVHATQESPASPQVQYFPSSTGVPHQEYATVTESAKNDEHGKFYEQSHLRGGAEGAAEVTVNTSPETYKSESASEDSVQINDQKQTGEGQNVADNLSSDHRLKLPNPSIVRVRTRVRGKSRGQVNFAASQSTTPSSVVRSKVEIKHVENAEPESSTKSNYFREYQPVKTSKYNQYRGLKKASRPTTEATATTESEQKANVYTIRPPRRPSSPSTVSTKRIRRPTTPIPSAESATETFGVSTPASYSDNSDFAPSGVSNDVYYEHTSLSPVRQKFRKFFGSAEQKSDVVPAFPSTPFPPTGPTHQIPTLLETYSEEINVVKDSQSVPLSVSDENPDQYPEWNPSESGLDVSGIVLTTTRTPGQEDEQEVLEEPKKFQDNKKAFDPDLEKKSGRRRVRVRVHKRPHENFETAESQNLRTVANVLVPPTTTYKPNDDSNIHQLAKNSDFSFGGQKFFGLRSREYFKKRLNLTGTENAEAKRGGLNVDGETESVQKEIKSTAGGETTETESKISGLVRKTEKGQKTEFESVSGPSGEGGEGGKISKPKFRGYVRKIVKPGRVIKGDSESNRSGENEEGEVRQENVEHHPKQIRINQGGFNHTGRFNGTRHRTFVRYVKKNKVRPHEVETHQESGSQEAQEEHANHQTTELNTQTPENQQTLKTETRYEHTDSEETKEDKTPETLHPVYQSTQENDNLKSSAAEGSEAEQTEQPEIQQVSKETTLAPESEGARETSSHKFQVTSQNSASRQTITQSEASVTQQGGLYLTQKPKFYQTLRPVFPRPSQRTREPGSYFSTTEQTIKEVQEKRDGPIRPKYGKTTGYGTTGPEKSEETKKLNEQQLKNKNLHALEVRKYLRTKNREGIFSQFSKNRYFTSEKTETVATTAGEKESEEITVPAEKTIETKSEYSKTESTSINAEPKTTQAFVAQTDSVEIGETTKNDEDAELHPTTTEVIQNSSEEEAEESSEEEEEEEEKDVTGSVKLETTTETKTEVPTTAFQASGSEVPQTVTESKTEESATERIAVHNTETQPDLYRFSKSSFSFDEAEKFTGTKNRAHVRNITADIIENTASFSAPGVEKRTDVAGEKQTPDDKFSATTEAHFGVTQKTEETTADIDPVEATTDYSEATEIETTAATEAVTKAKIAKLIKTSTTTKISHETEICYKGKCIRTKNENPDEDLKLLVDSASTMKIEKTKT